ncbi:Retrovirus-related Pol polyprotein from transposon TNT 1-94-like protein [Drosera capensis]
MKTTAHVMNRLAQARLGFMTSFEKPWKIKPTVSDFLVFGYVCYVFVPNHLRNKFDKKMMRCIFVGYDDQRIGWKYVNPNTSRGYKSRNLEKLYKEKEANIQPEVPQEPKAESSPKSSSKANIEPHLLGLVLFRPSDEEWKENVMIVLGCMDLDLAVRIEQPAALKDTSTPDEKREMEKWEHSIQSFRGTMSKEANAKSFLAELEKCFAKNKKVETSIFLTNLVSMRYKGKGNIREYILEMPHIVSKLKTLKLGDKVRDFVFEEEHVSLPSVVVVDHDESIVILDKDHETTPVQDILDNLPNQILDIVNEDQTQQSQEHEVSLRRSIRERRSVKPIGCKWIFKTKKDSEGNIIRFKARLVAKGYTQKEGIDFKKTLSPVSSKDSFRIIMALVAYFDLELYQIDVKIAFLNGDIEETIYMQLPENVFLGDPKKMVCKLKKSIYGLK